MTLFEIKSKNIQKIEHLSFFSAAKQFPEETIRYIYSRLREVVEVDSESVKRTFRMFNSAMYDSLEKKNLFLKDRSSFEIEINDDCSLSLEINAESLVISLYYGMMSGTKLRFDLEGSLKKIFDKVNDSLEKIKKVGSDFNSINSLRDEFRSKIYDAFNIDSIKKYFNKKGIRLQFKEKRRDVYELKLSTLLLEDIFNIPEKFTHPKLSKFTSYNIPALKNAISILDKKIKSNNYYIIDVGIARDGEWIDFSIKAANPDKKFKNKTFAEVHDMYIENVYQRVEDYEKLDERDILKYVFTGEV